jgi:GNAT superfamily N-acetyltransferase
MSMNMNVKPNSIEALRSVRRMEIKSKSDFCGGFFEDIGPAVLGGSEAVPDPHFNRISIIDHDQFDGALLAECIKKIPDGTPAFIDVMHPVSKSMSELMAANGWHPTGESRSSMLLTEYEGQSKEMEELDISLVEPDTLKAFTDLFLRGFDTPEELIPLATGIMLDLIPQNCGPEHFRLYLGTFRGEPACTQYLYFDGDEGGINMVSTKENLRGKGLATAMLRKVIDDALELGVRLLSLETRWNGAPERLYRRLGFATIARHEVFTNVPDLKYGI